MLGVYDRLAKVLYDTERDCEYPPWKCMNDKDIANRIIIPNTIENVFAINATQKMNNDIAVSLQNILRMGAIELLVDLETAKDVLKSSIPEYEEASNLLKIKEMAFYERPFLETRALVNEMVSLEYVRNEQTGTVTLYETGTNTKDRYVSVAYGSYFIGLLEKDFLSDDMDYDYDFSDDEY